MALIDSLADLFQGGFQGYKFGHDINEDVQERKRRISADADERFRYENEKNYREEQNRIREVSVRSAEDRAARALEARQGIEDQRYEETQKRDDRRYEQTIGRDAILNRYNLGRDAANDRRDNASSAASTALTRQIKEMQLADRQEADRRAFTNREMDVYAAKAGSEATDVNQVIGNVQQRPGAMAEATRLGLGFERDWMGDWANRRKLAQVAAARARQQPLEDYQAEVQATSEAPASEVAAPRRPTDRPAQAAAPTGDNGSLRAQAQAAIAKGANPAAVAARFKQLTGQDL